MIILQVEIKYKWCYIVFNKSVDNQQYKMIKASSAMKVDGINLYFEVVSIYFKEDRNRGHHKQITMILKTG